ncbi:hypothetical protein C8D87_11445 [Lentzea atacamensis]|uniref:Uncharacterized protein n=1 Tax=Lentzea atacamensis TaxID=531938 RepID=A0ABX9DY06_9PSEU|nr:hypothetical protein [Lentzea atacamensis]RAS59433.1 hypothetical protein C8D87_11445 [Lentzea atacamensis]
MPAIDIALPDALPPDYVFQQGRTYGNVPTFLYLNTGYPKLATAVIRIDAGDYRWNHIAQAPFCVAWKIPVIVATAELRELLQRLVPLFQTVAAGLDVDPDPNPPTTDVNDPNFDADCNRPVGTQVLTPAAEQARQRIADELATAFADWPLVETHDVALTTEQELELEQRIAPDAEIYPDLTELAETLRAAAPPVTPGNYVMIPGLVDRLRAIRDRVRERELQRLEAISNTIRTATADRDRLLSQASTWKDTSGTTSQRALAERTGLTHRGVGKIIGRRQVEESLGPQDLPELTDADVAVLHLGPSTPEQRYHWASCEHPAARVHAAADTVFDEQRGSHGLPVRPAASTDLSRFGELRSDWSIGTCGTCCAPVVTFRLHTADGTWQTPWVLLQKHGEPEW